MLDITNQIPVCVSNTNLKPKRRLEVMSFPLFYLFSNYLLGRFCTEGILLDPVYTGKAFASMLDLIEKGQLGSNEPIIFLHTGGLPALFAFET
jgi:hypothetical protein